MKKLYVS